MSEVTWWSAFVAHLHTNSPVSTALLVGAFFITRWSPVRLVRGHDAVLHEEQRRWISRIKNSALILLLIGLVFVWLAELNTFALPITVFAVAFVIATKELILYISGTSLRTGTQAYQVGDWIDVPNPDPRVYLTTNELAKNVFTVIVFCPMREAVDLEQKITRDFLDFFYRRRKAPDVKQMVG